MRDTRDVGLRATGEAIARVLLAVPALLVVVWAAYAIGAGYAGLAVPAPANAVLTLVLVGVIAVSLWHWVREPLRR